MLDWPHGSRCRLLVGGCLIGRMELDTAEPLRGRMADHTVNDVAELLRGYLIGRTEHDTAEPLRGRMADHTVNDVAELL